jgi:hypothetical protein
MYYESTAGDGFYHYISNPWQILDWCSILLFCTVFWMWFAAYIPMVQDFKPQLRYNVYQDYFSGANYVNNIRFTEYDKLVTMFTTAQDITDLMKLHMQLNGICLLMVLFRILKLLDFQPRLGIVTKTIATALSDIIHWFLPRLLLLPLACPS